MFRVAAVIATQVVLHVDQFFRNHHIQRVCLRPINTFRVNQDGVFAQPRQKGVSTAISRRDPPPYPPRVRRRIGRHDQVGGLQPEHSGVVMHHLPDNVVTIDEPYSESFLTF